MESADRLLIRRIVVDPTEDGSPPLVPDLPDTEIDWRPGETVRRILVDPQLELSPDQKFFAANRHRSLLIRKAIAGKEFDGEPPPQTIPLAIVARDGRSLAVFLVSPSFVLPSTDHALASLLSDITARSGIRHPDSIEAIPCVRRVRCRTLGEARRPGSPGKRSGSVGVAD